ncbi:MAG: nucleotidyltransferase family protein [Bryobacteraceae bacterium]
MCANRQKTGTANNGDEAPLPVAAALILAAGAATRMGSLKQLLPFGQGTLISNAIEQAKDACFETIVVVVGAQGDLVTLATGQQGVEIVENPDWPSGMGTSIRVGLEHITKQAPGPEVLAVLLADQPLVRASHLLEMRRMQAKSRAPILAAQYSGQNGVPALFARDLFPSLAALPADAGARHLLRGGSFPVLSFPLPEAATDVDTPADFARLAMVRP